MAVKSLLESRNIKQNNEIIFGVNSHDGLGRVRNGRMLRWGHNFDQTCELYERPEPISCAAAKNFFFKKSSLEEKRGSVRITMGINYLGCAVSNEFSGLRDATIGCSSRGRAICIRLNCGLRLKVDAKTRRSIRSYFHD